MKYKLFFYILLISLSNSMLAQTDKSIKKNKIFTFRNVLSKSKGNIDIDSIYTANQRKANNYQDRVILVSLNEDIGDYSRIHVKSNNYDYYFLDDQLFLQNKNENISDGDSILIHWMFVINHAIDNPNDKYRDIAIKKIEKIEK